MDTSFKAVIFDSRGRVLLGTNPRSEWELLGGRADPDDTDPAATIRRELREEAGIEVTVGPLIDIWYYNVPAEGRVAVASYLAEAVAIESTELRVSEEHGSLAFFPADQLDVLNLPAGYKSTIQRAHDLALPGQRREHNDATPHRLRGR